MHSTIVADFFNFMQLGSTILILIGHWEEFESMFPVQLRFDPSFSSL